MADAPREIGLTATVRGQEIKVSQLTVQSRVNQLATVQVVGHQPEDAQATSSSAAVTVSKFATRVGALQRYILTTARWDPDFTVQATDGGGGALDFAGFLSAPGLSLGDRGVMMSYSGVHRAALLDFFSGDIFSKNGFGQEGAEKRSNVFAADEQIKGSIASRLLQHIERDMRLMSEGLTTKATPNPIELALKKAGFERNKLVLAQVRAFLNASAATTVVPVIDSLVETTDSQNPQLVTPNEFLNRALTMEGGLLNILLNVLPEAFGLQFVCLLSGTPGARLELLHYTAASAGAITVPVEGIEWGAGSEMDLPITGVVVRGAARYQTMTNAQSEDPTATNQFLSTVAYYPEAALVRPGGRIAQVEAPPWINPQVIIPATVPQTSASLGELKAGITRLRDIVQLDEPKLRQLLGWWAQLKFSYLSLLRSRASAQIPLNFAVQPGRVYDVHVVADEGGTHNLFRAYVQAVTHHVSSNQGSLEASTRVEFSHVQAAGYEQAGLRPTL